MNRYVGTCFARLSWIIVSLITNTRPTPSHFALPATNGRIRWKHVTSYMQARSKRGRSHILLISDRSITVCLRTYDISLISFQLRLQLLCTFIIPIYSKSNQANVDRATITEPRGRCDPPPLEAPRNPLGRFPAVDSSPSIDEAAQSCGTCAGC